ncbi:hypothetical protein [Maribacter sp. HTCC2170]|uniref:hypothetical protein n=1 Tax=Maribacter sp. (strain HTCC2170 / KCCM 42371) TaxID=313603 RepID=UPI00006B1AF0|nr:hypothetical protein [Maribacter sp. HTCC2170]EAR00799.1 hypothetical protein FB2170_16981 [Maribacter sp. HTCC2170]
MLEKIIFVYNANSGKHNMILDSLHKIFSPSTYECNLCDITYGVFAENKVWKKFRKETKLSMEFLHRDEFTKKYGSKAQLKFEYPVVLTVVSGDLKVLVQTKEMNAMQRAEDLIKIIQQRV